MCSVDSVVGRVSAPLLVAEVPLLIRLVNHADLRHNPAVSADESALMLLDNQAVDSVAVLALVLLQIFLSLRHLISVRIFFGSFTSFCFDFVLVRELRLIKLFGNFLVFLLL